MRFGMRLTCLLGACALGLMVAASLVSPRGVGAVACNSAEDCDDGNPCTTDFCNSAQCAFVANSLPCNDGDPCTENDVCADSACGGFPVDCDDQNPCTDDTCDSAGNAFLCVNTPNGSCAGNCGNGILDPGETCDPPGGALPPHGAPCRSDCTYCGDGVVQAPETCDDANTVSGCRPDLPQKPLDGCLDSCTQPICADPAQVKFGTTLDLVAVHGRLVTSTSLDLANEHFVIQLTPGGSTSTVIFRTSLTKGSLTQASAAAFKYSNKAARTAGGIYGLKINGKDGYYKFTMKAYGEALGAQSDMRTQVFVGTEEWRARGLWKQLTKGWTLKKNATFLQP